MRRLDENAEIVMVECCQQYKQTAYPKQACPYDRMQARLLYDLPMWQG